MSISRFTTSLSEYLTLEQLKAKCPIAFSEVPTNPDLSERYVYVSTEVIVKDLEKLGWHAVSITGKKGKSSKHMITFQNPDIIIKGKDGDDVYPRILLTNSHDGSSSFKFSIGIYRLVCSNGLVVADAEYKKLRLLHRGYSFNELSTLIEDVIEDLPNRVTVINKMKGKVLTEKQQYDLAINAILIRSNISLGSEEATAATSKIDPSTITELLTPTRNSDMGDDLWVVMNVLQEKILKGGFAVGAKKRKLRKITSFDRDMEINKKLFETAVNILA